MLNFIICVTQGIKVIRLIGVVFLTSCSICPHWKCCSSKSPLQIDYRDLILDSGRLMEHVTSTYIKSYLRDNSWIFRIFSTKKVLSSRVQFIAELRSCSKLRPRNFATMAMEVSSHSSCRLRCIWANVHARLFLVSFFPRNRKGARLFLPLGSFSIWEKESHDTCDLAYLSRICFAAEEERDSSFQTCRMNRQWWYRGIGCNNAPRRMVRVHFRVKEGRTLGLERSNLEHVLNIRGDFRFSRIYRSSILWKVTKQPNFIVGCFSHLEKHLGWSRNFICIGNGHWYPKNFSITRIMFASDEK